MKNKDKRLREDRIGEENYNAHGTLMRIVEYNRNDNIIVEFQDEYKYRKECTYQCFKNGDLVSPYDKTIYGVGYIGEGKYECKKDRFVYKFWHGMLQRCYDPYFINRHNAYKDVFVCDEWLCFQNFAKWFYENYYEVEGQRMELDKDILVKGNKIYSPETCIFVPRRINLILIDTKRRRGDCPIGVCQKNTNGGFQTYCSNGNKQLYLGTLDTKRKAWLMYKINKELVVQSVADEYKHLIPGKLYDILYKYEVKIDD